MGSSPPFSYEGQRRPIDASGRINELYSNQIIDKRLYEWGKELKDNRNLATHASDHVLDRDDAEDLFDFAMAMCEYVFVLTERFAAFKKRRLSKKAQQQQQPMSHYHY